MWHLIMSLLAAASLAIGQEVKIDTTNAEPVSVQVYENKVKTLPIVSLTNDAVLAYENNPAFKPKLDFTPTGNIAPPKDAGVSYLKVSGRVIGGSKAVQRQYPWQAFLVVSGTLFCGGSLITPNWVLTAASCVYRERSFVITIGGVDRVGKEANEATQTATKVTCHRDYNANTLVNDIALINLPGFALNTYVNVIRLPKLSEATKTFTGASMTVCGYGRTANTGSISLYLNFAALAVVDNSKCAAVFGSTSVVSSTICTGADLSKAVCYGDLGGPLFYKEADGRFTQIGIASFVASASCTNKPAGYTRLTSFLGWISSTTGLAIRP